MKYYSMQLPDYRCVKLFRIVPNPVNTNVYFSVYRLARFGKVKGDNICEVVVIKVLFIDL